MTPLAAHAAQSAYRDSLRHTVDELVPLGEFHHRLGPYLGSLPPDVLREVLLPKLDELTRGFFGITAGACWQVLKDAGLTCKLDSNQLSVRAAGEGYLRYLVFAIYEGKPRGTVSCTAAAGSGHLDCLIFLHRYNCDWDATTCTAAALGGHLECLQFLHQHGCPWNARACEAAASGGHLACLQFMYRRGCPWDEFVYVAAAGEGHMGCIEFARENHCDWTSHMTYAAAGDDWFGSDFLAWACGWEGDDDDECEPPWTVDERTGQRARNCGHLDVLKWAREHGCPFGDYTV